MLSKLCRSAVVVVVVAGCDDGSTRAPVTIVVDTDGARAREDTQRLREVQQGVQADRAQLERARDDLAAARKSLESAASPAQKASWQTEVRALEMRLNREAVAADVVTRAELDLQLRAQEERIKSFISAELQGGSARAPTTTTTTRAASPARALITEGKRHLLGLAVDAADVAAVQAALAQAEQALARGDDAAAEGPARAFVDQAKAVVVDRALVRAKYQRVAAVLASKTLAPEQRSRADALLKTATQLSTSDAPGANRALNEVLALAR